MCLLISLIFIAVLTRQPSVPLWPSPHTNLTAAQLTEMKVLASQVLGVKVAEETQESNTMTNADVITPVSTATSTTQTEVEEAKDNNTKATTTTQTEAEEVSVWSLLEKTEGRLGDQMNQVRVDILAQILPVLQNIQQEMKELRQNPRFTPVQSVPLSPEKPTPSPPPIEMFVTPEKPGVHSSPSLISDQEEIPAGQVVEETTEEGKEVEGKENDVGKEAMDERKETVDEEKQLNKKENEATEDGGKLIEEENKTIMEKERGNDSMKGNFFEDTSPNAMETEEKREDSEEDEVNDSGVGSEQGQSQGRENSIVATPSEIEENKGRKREAGKVFEEEIKPRMKKKKVVKRISREEEDEEELKPGEEKVVHRQKALLCVEDDGGWEERGRGEIKVIKHLRTGQVRLELRGAQYGEVCLSQPLSPEVLSGFTRAGATDWRWRDPRMREQLQLSLDTQLDCEGFKRALDDSVGRKSLFGFIQNFYVWSWN